nr:DUF4157 domain-containing protein [Pseudenhygromyxa sp. WMMC2535]
MCSACEAEARDEVQEGELRRVADTGGLVQRACASCEVEQEEEAARRKEEAGGARGGRTSEPFTTRVHNLQRSGGRALPRGARGQLESRLGVELGGVRVHAGAEAGRLAREINARAFTVGQHVFFAAGELRLEERGGMRLLAHEVAHTLQNSGQVERLRRAPTQAQSAAEAALESAERGEDLLTGDPKLLARVDRLRFRLMEIVEDVVIPNEAEGMPSGLADFGVPEGLRKRTDRAAKRFFAITRYFEQRETLESVLMSQWLDAGIELLSLLGRCVKKAREAEPLIGEVFEEEYGKRLQNLFFTAKKLRKHAFFEQGAALEATLRPLEEAKARADREAKIQAELAKVREEMSAYWNWQPLKDIRAEHERLSRKLLEMGGKSKTGVLEVQLEVLAGLNVPENFEWGPSMTERSQTLAKAVMDDIGRGARMFAKEIEGALSGGKADGTRLEVVLGAFRWVDFYDEGTTKSERLAPMVLEALSDPSVTLTALSRLERGKVLISWLSPDRRPELGFAMRVIWADPEAGEQAGSAKDALEFLREIGAGGRPRAVKQATSMLSKSGALTRYAGHNETLALLVEMVYQLWFDRFDYGFVGTGDALASAITGGGGEARAWIPIVGSLRVERVGSGDEFRVRMNLRDYGEAEGLGADGKTANEMWNGGGVLVRARDRVGLLTEEGRVLAPAMKLLELGAMAERGLLRAGGQELARWSSETAKSLNEGVERRAKARVEWLEAGLEGSGDVAKRLVGQVLEGEDLERAKWVIDGLEQAGIGAYSSGEGFRTGLLKGAVNTAGGVGELGGNAMAGGAEFGSDVLDGRGLSELEISYDELDHDVRVTVDAAPEIAGKIYEEAVEKFEKGDMKEKVFMVSDAGGQVVFEVLLEVVGGGATKLGKADDFADAARLLDRFDDGRDLSKGLDLSKLSGRSRELVDRGLLGSARHNEALNAGKRRELDAKSWGKVKSEIPEGTKVWVDEELPIGEVRVEYDAPGGVVKAESVRIVTGPGPEAKRIRLHGETVRLVRKYSGLQGEVRRLLSRLRFYLTGVDRGAGSVLWEAKMEVEKLDRGMSEWMGDLLGADPGGAGAEKARRELEGIGGQYEYWRRVSEGEISRRESRGYIAMEGDEASLGLEALEEAGDGAGGSRLGGERVYAPGAAERSVLPEGEGARVSQESSVSSVPKSISRADLGDKLGSGGNKDVFAFGADLAVGVLKPGKKAEGLVKEIQDLKILEDAGLPTVRARGPIDVDGRPGVIFDRFAAGSKDVVKVVGQKPKVVGSSSLLNSKSATELRKILKKMQEIPVKIDDLQFLIARDGRIVIADPLRVAIGSKPNRKNMRMIQLLIDVAEGRAP